MKKILFLLLFFPAFAWAGVKTDLFCPVASSDVLISFEYRSVSNIVVSSNIASFTLPETPVGVFSSFQFLGKSDASGQVPFVASSGAFQNMSCVAAPVYNQSFLLGLSGLVAGALLIYAILSAM